MVFTDGAIAIGMLLACCSEVAVDLVATVHASVANKCGRPPMMTSLVENLVAALMELV